MSKPFLLVAAFQVILLACVLSTAAFPQAEKRNEPAAISFEDVTAHAGITFEHAVSPDKKYLYESMSGGVLLIDYDGDGWLDIYFTNAQSVAMTLSGQRAKSALYRNNHDGTFTDVTDRPVWDIRARRWAVRWVTTTTTDGRTWLSPARKVSFYCATMPMERLP